MSEIQYMEKPDWVPWKDVCDCIHDANIVNDKRGFHMPFADITPEEIEKELENGKCFIALRDGKVIGTGSYRIRNLRKWYAWGKAVYYCLDGIRPEYQGTDVYFGIAELRDRSRINAQEALESLSGGQSGLEGKNLNNAAGALSGGTLLPFSGILWAGSG